MTMTTSGATQRVRRTTTGPVIAVAAVLLVVVVAAIVTGVVLGARWFDVRTPSMGTAAPVGSLVVTMPVRVSGLRVGDVITFHPPGTTGGSYTHRVVDIDDGTLTTRGDVNGAVDGWRLHQADLVGRAVAVLPGVGWALRALPLVAAGCAVVWLLTRRLAVTVRSIARSTGVALVVSAVGAVLRPFVALELVETTTAAHPHAVLVSTGLLPVRASIAGVSAVLHPGQVARLPIPADAAGAYHVATGLAWSPTVVAVVLGVALAPLAWNLVVGARPPLSDPHPLGVVEPA